MRDWYRGCAGVFQTSEKSSNLLSRSTIDCFSGIERLLQGSILFNSDESMVHINPQAVRILRNQHLLKAIKVYIKDIIDAMRPKFSYKADTFRFFDWWVVMKEKEGILYGDCEDFSLTAIWKLCNCSVLTFLWKVIISHQYRIYFCKTKNGVNHAVGYANDLWFDNWTLKALPKSEFLKKTGHNVYFFIPSPLILFNMILGSIARLFGK